MKKNRKQRLAVLLVAILAVLTLAGCGGAELPEAVEQSSLQISSKGMVTSWLVSDFDKDYYNVNELTSMAVDEAITYNLAHPLEDGREAVVVETAETFSGGKKVRLGMSYVDCDTYADYNGEILFYGTVAEAVQRGYDFNTRVKSVAEDGEALSGTDIKLDGSKQLLITNARTNVYCPRKVTYVSEQVTLNSDGSVNTTQTDAVVYILMK